LVALAPDVILATGTPLMTALQQATRAVPLARRLAVIMHRMWVDGTEFRWTREVAVA
jgi:hypothetical protein